MAALRQALEPVEGSERMGKGCGCGAAGALVQGEKNGRRGV